MIRINDTVTIRKGAELRGFYSNGGEFTRLAGRTYKVRVLQHFISKDRNEIHWEARHGNYLYTDIGNVIYEKGQERY